MIQLDPAAVDAAAKALANSLNLLGSGWTEEASTIVTAYLAAIEPQVRAAVAEVVECASDVEQSRHWGEKRHGRAVADLDDARTALFAVRNRLTTCSA